MANSRLLKSSLIVSAGTMVSRVLGLVRDVVMANLLGATHSADAFYVAFKIPNFFRRLFAEGAFAQAFVPVLSEYKENGGLAAVQDLANRVLAILGASLFTLCVLAWFAAPGIAWVFASGFHQYPDKLALTADLIRWTFPYLGFISLVAFAGGILNTYGRYAVPALTPVLLNLSLIGAALWLTPWAETPAHALAFGVLIAGVSQLLFQVPFLWRLSLLPRPVWDTQHPGVRKILLLMAPAMLAVSVSQINLLLDTVLASWLEGGSVAWLYYSDRLTELPLGVIGIAIGTVVLPSLSALSAKDDRQAFRDGLAWAVRTVLLLGVPAAVALWVLATPILSTLFFHGAMTPYDVMQSTASLQAYTLGLTAFMLVKVLAPGFFSRQDMKTPVKIATAALLANMVFNLILIWPLAHVGLALATSISAWLNAGLLAWMLTRQGYFEPLALLRHRRTLAIGASALLMALVLSWLAPAAEWWLMADLQQRTVQLAALIGVGLLVYVAGLGLLGWRPSHLSR
ncbi:MAG: murein biosynthesis integral membrane protein MurJ [Natronospirillum sp.]|uniref:murein biosynthesis integral membrane protein MurJ n=1 Tax=Natronospirillum sp. TaxID=2812955 RepID=UPI0025EFE4C4|nr:murein biosynthesis integral membrane protein MurJ [Natronospirillum sp.]MCH8550498.1 murein biosynthesis integral membrane protein MurJ [Natronospirillum sp.]